VKLNAIAENAPNLITLARICAVPLLVWLILSNHFAAAFWVFAAAGISDALDGYIAKRFNLVTVLGAYMDPVADKALLVSAYVTLGHSGHIDTWLVILVVFRDALIIGGTILFHTLNRPVAMQPLMISKINTAVQIVLVCVVLAEIGIGTPPFDLVPALTIITALTTAASGVAYLCRWVFDIRLSPRWRPDNLITPGRQRLDKGKPMKNNP
jgi:cardiolipin synthase (CMP-forming)